MRVGLGFPEARSRSDVFIRERLAWEPPSLPGLTPGTVRRWEGMATWQPPETVVLARHRALDRPHWIVTNRRDPPEGYLLEYDLGLPQRHEQPGTRRLVIVGDTFALDDGTDGDARVLGHIEQAPFPMMDLLELRRVRATGQHVLASGAADPMQSQSDPVAALGFVEAFPIQPKEVDSGTPPPRHLALLVRTTDRERWRHAYAAAEWEERDRSDPAALVLGAIWTRAMPGTVELRRTADGRLVTELLSPPGRTGAELAATVPRWVVAPLAWSRRPRAWALRATASRARHAARASARASTAETPAVLGHLRADPAPGYSPLYSAHHPVLADQFVTRSALEATDLGYRLDGILGHVADVGAERHRGPQEILWGSRFGRRRRYAEG